MRQKQMTKILSSIKVEDKMVEKKTSTKKKSETWLVVWDDGGDDPVHKCRSFAEARNKVNELVNDDGILPEDVQVYKVIVAYKVQLDLVEV